MTDKKNINQKVNNILSEISFVKDIQPDQKIRVDLGFDSLKMAEMLCALEDAFDIELQTEDLNPESIITVSDLYVLLAKYKKEGCDVV